MSYAFIHEHVAGDMLIFQSMQSGSNQLLPLEEDYPFEETGIFHESGYPKLHFIEHRYADDPTNWWVPNSACAEAMLRSSGFEITAHPEAEVYICRVASQSPHAFPIYPNKGAQA